METSSPKLGLLILKEKNEAKTLIKPEKCPPTSACIEKVREGPVLVLWVLIQLGQN